MEGGLSKTMGKGYSPEQIVRKLREAEGKLASGFTIGEVAREFGISEPESLLPEPVQSKGACSGARDAGASTPPGTNAHPRVCRLPRCGHHPGSGGGEGEGVQTRALRRASRLRAMPLQDGVGLRVLKVALVVDPEGVSNPGPATPKVPTKRRVSLRAGGRRRPTVPHRYHTRGPKGPKGGMTEDHEARDRGHLIDARERFLGRALSPDAWKKPVAFTVEDCYLFAEDLADKCGGDREAFREEMRRGLGDAGLLGPREP